MLKVPFIVDGGVFRDVVSMGGGVFQRHGDKPGVDQLDVGFFMMW